MQCIKCGDKFPVQIAIDGKIRNLQNRKYCLKCSPFGQHNTRKLEAKKSICEDCGREKFRKNEKGRKCWVCANKCNRKKKIEKIKELTGDACWICGYNKCWGALDFHHVDPSTKSFGLTAREIQFSWKRIEPELRKCILVCCRCHREIHGNILDVNIESLWLRKWKLIDDGVLHGGEPFL